MRFNKFGIAKLYKDKVRNIRYNGLFRAGNYSVTPAEFAAIYQANINSQLRIRGYEI